MGRTAPSKQPTQRRERRTTDNLADRYMDPLDERLEQLRSMSVPQLVEAARDEFNKELDPENGQLWLLKKISYLVLEKIKGPLTGRAAERALALDTPNVIEFYKKEAQAEQSNGGNTMGTKTGEKKEKKSAVELDNYGFRKGSKFSQGFEALLKGITGEAFQKLVGKATSGGMRGNLRCKHEDCSSGRGAEIARLKLDNGDSYFQITSYHDVATGKVVKVALNTPKNVAKPEDKKEKAPKAPKAAATKEPAKAK